MHHHRLYDIHSVSSIIIAFAHRISLYGVMQFDDERLSFQNTHCTSGMAVDNTSEQQHAETVSTIKTNLSSKIEKIVSAKIQIRTDLMYIDAVCAGTYLRFV